MVANINTITKIVVILRRRLSEAQIKTLVRELLEETVPSGNKSYDETINRLAEAIGLL